MMLTDEHRYHIRRYIVNYLQAAHYTDNPKNVTQVDIVKRDYNYGYMVLVILKDDTPQSTNWPLMDAIQTKAEADQLITEAKNYRDEILKAIEGVL